jgi:hypothetical protein
MQHRSPTRRTAAAIAACALALGALAGCGGGDEESAEPASGGRKAQRILPVDKNPISNSATAPGLTITKALVENNVSAETGEDVPDHLEIALKNTTGKPVQDVEVFYEIIDKTKNVSEGYYTKLNGFVIPPGGTRVAHFDNTGQRDHFPVNEYSLYYTDQNELFVDVIAAAPGFKPATFTARKDAASAEAGVEQD